uniref:Large ribosomal subunit protein uL11m n=1 Tax=Glaucocystis incrassata TaxID=1789788 RepID=A0A3G1IVG7_9EUKA|nr:ribosomal protein L11 [Glaucocystis incrassata]ASQ40031.1 ribosomal protein L11 [Glaucocystis incrassata]
MAKKIIAVIKLVLTAGKATPAPPVGPALGPYGVSSINFCKEYNAKTADKAGLVIPAEITVYDDRTFSFVLKTPPASVLIAKAAGIDKGSGTPNKKKVGSINKAQLQEIAQVKFPDLNTKDLDMAARIIEGTARNMGITITD